MTPADDPARNASEPVAAARETEPAAEPGPGSPVAVAPRPKRARLVSIDAARGAVVALMILMDHPSIPTAVPWWLKHPAWDGFRLADSVFPAFLFIGGVSMAFSAAKGGTGWKPALVFLRRIAVLFALGLFLEAIVYPPPLRFTGVLQRIAITTLIAYPFRNSRRAVILAAAAALLVVHTVVLLHGAPGVPPESLGPQVNMARLIDTTVIGAAHVYKHNAATDPEGLLGLLSSSAEVLLGLALGKTLLAHGREKGTHALLLGIGAAGVAASLAAWPWLPANKPLWTATFTVISASSVCIALVALHWWVDIRGHTSWPKAFVSLGRNALFVYIGSNILVTALRHLRLPPASTETAWAMASAATARVVGLRAGTLTLSIVEICGWIALAVVMERKRIFVKL